MCLSIHNQSYSLSKDQIFQTKFENNVPSNLKNEYQKFRLAEVITTP